MPSRSTPAVRLPPGFEEEFPDASRRATEAFLNLGMLAGAVRSAVDAIVAEEGLPSMAAFNVLSVLAGDPEPLQPSTVADRMMVTRATVTGVLDSLESRGLLRRAPHASDGRSRTVSLTRSGRRLVARLVPRLHAFERDLMTVLTDRELDRLLASVAALQARIVELAPTARLGIR
jgi:DNA-binding MarR family transcriptional regulator